MTSSQDPDAEPESDDADDEPEKMGMAHVVSEMIRMPLITSMPTHGGIRLHESRSE